MLTKGKSEVRLTNRHGPRQTYQETPHRSRSDLERTENKEIVMKFGIIIKSKKGVFDYTTFMGELVTAYSLLVGELNW